MTIEELTALATAFQSALATFQAADAELDEASRKLEALPEYKAWDKARDSKREAQNALNVARVELAGALGGACFWVGKE